MDTSTSSTGPTKTLDVIGYDSGEAFMALGASALHDHVANRVQAALGQPLPQMEVRFHNISLSADIVVKDETELKTELPTLVNTVKMAAVRCPLERHETRGDEGDFAQREWRVETRHHDARAGATWVWQVVATQGFEWTVPYQQASPSGR